MHESRPLVNDVHSRLNATRVRGIVPVDSLDALRAALEAARRDGAPVCIAGGRHAMGGQQFAAGAVLLDLRRLNRVVGFDAEHGLIEVEAGMQWPALIEYLHRESRNAARAWAIAQKQTGADDLTIGGALAANVHGRGLRMRPFVADVESFVLVDADGVVRRCSRAENGELFRLAIGGYGLFGVIATATLRLVPRTKVRRDVRLMTVDELMPAFERRIADGYTYGDFQFAIDAAGDDFLRRGVFSCYRPVDDETPLTATPRKLGRDDWLKLVHLAHTDKRRAFEMYAGHYLATDGQVYWSDLQQLSVYVADYHAAVASDAGKPAASEVITEVYVPRAALAGFLAAAAEELRRRAANVIYGTVRLIERDDESFLKWAREAYACIIFNLHVEHSPRGMDDASGAFRALIDLALARGGSFYLTYHRFATREQVESAYPQFEDFVAAKRRFDPGGRFQSTWWRHYVAPVAKQ